MLFSTTADIVAGITAGVLVIQWILSKQKSKLALPPGPRGLPLLGNALDMPTVRPWEGLFAMSKKYESPIIHLDILGLHMVVVNDFESVNTIFTKRAVHYSGRPRLTILNEMAGYAWSIAFMSYGPIWKIGRRLFEAHFKESEVKQMWPQELRSTHKLLNLLLTEPDHFHDHFRFFAARTILDVGYGIEVESYDDRYIQVVEASLKDLDATVGYDLIEAFPALRHLPAWFPGMGFKYHLKDWERNAAALRDVPFKAVKSTEVTKSSVVSKLLEENAGNEEIETHIAGSMAVAFAAASDTTVATLTGLLLCLLRNPEVQTKVHEELDRVIGGDRLPEFSDKKNLPYLRAVLAEVLRWNCVMPMAIPHTATQDDIWVSPRGISYMIPKGAMVIGNAWALSRDESTYPNPDAFIPERYLTKDGQYNLEAPYPDYVFGFRARICPGRWMAEDMVFIAAASILTAFRLESPEATRLQEAQFGDLFSHKFAMEPKLFKCELIPRSEKAAKIVKEAYSFV
ncbi:cytochrome P450 [Flagelloscypha sp. PMI_526]|nr:cytochrome P450 [Flagelloscypha sp. PMI_526]